MIEHRRRTKQMTTSVSLSVLPDEIILKNIAKFLWSPDRLKLYQAIESTEYTVCSERRTIVMNMKRLNIFYENLMADAEESSLEFIQCANSLYKTYRLLFGNGTVSKTSQDHIRIAHVGMKREVLCDFRDALEKLWINDSAMEDIYMIQCRYDFDVDYYIEHAVADFMALPYTEIKEFGEIIADFTKHTELELANAICWSFLELKPFWISNE